MLTLVVVKLINLVPLEIQGEGAKADTEYSGENVKTIIGQDADGNTTIDVKPLIKP